MLYYFLPFCLRIEAKKGISHCVKCIGWSAVGKNLMKNSALPAFLTSPFTNEILICIITIYWKSCQNYILSFFFFFSLLKLWSFHTIKIEPIIFDYNWLKQKYIKYKQINFEVGLKIIISYSRFKLSDALSALKRSEIVQIGSHSGNHTLKRSKLNPFIVLRSAGNLERNEKFIEKLNKNGWVKIDSWPAELKLNTRQKVLIKFSEQCFMNRRSAWKRLYVNLLN